MSVIELSRNLIMYPSKTFLDIHEGHFKGESFQAFCLAALITFIKSFFSHQKAFNFYENELLNQFFSFLSIPQISWALSYFSFFIFIYIVSLFGRIIGWSEIKANSLLYVFMSISIYGIFLHAIFAITRFVLPHNLNKFTAYLSFLGIAMLFSYALKKVGGLSTIKTIFLFLISAIPIVFVAGLTGIFPFLMWLNI